MLPFILIFMFCSSAYCGLQTPSSENVEELYKYREYLSYINENCISHFNEQGKLNSKKICMNGIFVEYEDNDLKDWKQNANSIIESFFQICASIDDLPINKSIFIQSDTLVTLLVHLLPSKKAFKYLYTDVPYEMIRKHSREIQDIFNTHPDDKNKSQLLRLLLLTDLHQKKKEEFLAANYLEKEFRATLGDTATENEIISLYKQIKGEKITAFSEREKYIKQLSRIGTKKSIKTLIESFNEPVFSRNIPEARNASNAEKIRAEIQKYGIDKVYPIVESIRWPILVELAKHHYRDSIFKDNMTALSKNTYNSDQKKAFLSEFRAWAVKNYHTEPILPDTNMVIK